MLLVKYWPLAIAGVKNALYTTLKHAIFCTAMANTGQAIVQQKERGWG